MKSLLLTFVAVLLIAGLVVTPATAAPSTASTCGSTYVVQRGDYLSRIARYCGVSLSSLIAANPQIHNYNRIYPGQVINIDPNATPPTDPGVPVTGTTTYVVRWGDTMALIAWRFGTSLSYLISLNPQIVNPSWIYAGQVIYVPSGTNVPGPYEPGPYVPVTGSRISISAAAAKPGASVTVSVWSFPANAEVDFRLGKQGAAFSVVKDGTTDAYGRASTTFTIPSTAVAGEKWVILVLTTSQPAGKNVETTSPVITIQ